MPLRLLAYLTETSLAHRKKEGAGWPGILLFVLHQGPERWTVPVNFRDLLGAVRNGGRAAAVSAIL